MLSTSPIAATREAARRFPERLVDAADPAKKHFAGLSDALAGHVENLVVLDDVGPGGTADVYAALCERYSRIPVLKAHVTEPPSFIREKSVVVLFADEVSRELLDEASHEVSERGAHLVLIVSRSNTSVLGLAGADRRIICSVDPSEPWGSPGLAELLAYGVALLEAIGGMSDGIQLLRSAAEELRAELPRLAADGGLADTLAEQLSDGVPVVVGNGVLGEAAAHVWKACLNVETGRLAFSSSLYDAKLLAPTLIDPPVAGSEQTTRANVDKRFLFILLYHGDDDPRILEALGDLTHFLDQRAIPHVQVEPRTVDLLARFLESLALGQLVSLRRSELVAASEETAVYQL